MNDGNASNMWWVVAGVLAGMPRPFIHTDRRMNLAGAMTDYDDDLPSLHAAGIRVIVSFLDIPSDGAIYESAGFLFLKLPFADGGPPTIEQASEFVRFVDRQRAENRPVAIHCEEGLGRTGTMMAAYFIWHGQTARDAIATVRKVEKLAIQTERQVKFLDEVAATWSHRIKGH